MFHRSGLYVVSLLVAVALTLMTAPVILALFERITSILERISR